MITSTFLALRESVRLFFYIIHPCQTDTLHPPDRRTLPIQLDIPLSLGHHDTHSYRVITLLLHSLTVSNEYSTSSLAFYFFAVDLFSIYEELRGHYVQVSEMATNPGRGFGLRSRKSNAPSRPPPPQNRWIQVKPKSNDTTISTLDGPTPPIRERVERKFTTYCALHLGHPKQHPPPTKLKLIREVFSILRSADPTLAIQPYLDSYKVNSVCHASHLVDIATEFENYFPETRYYHKRFRTKCRFTSSVPIPGIKSKVFDQLRVHDFWVNPTTIKSYETERCGYFLYAHPDYAFRPDIMDLLTPLVTPLAGEDNELEFDVQPERLNIKTSQRQIGEKVVMLRTTPKYNEQIQTLLSSLYAENNTTDIGSLRKYAFIPMSIPGDLNNETAQGLLRSQQLFRQNVYYFICKNIFDYDKSYEIPIENFDDDKPPETTNHSAPASEQSENTEHNDTPNTNANDNSDQNDKTPDTTTKSTTEQYSLRDWLYDLDDNSGSPLIHGAYRSAHKGKIFVLCEQAKVTQVLHVLHNIVQYASTIFSDDALTTYFGGEKADPCILNHPRSNTAHGTYASSLSALATAANPQDEMKTTTSSNQNNRTTKRLRDDSIKTNKSASYAKATSGATQPLPEDDPDIDEMMTTLKNNMDNLGKIEETQQAQDTKNKLLDDAITRLTTGHSNHGKVLKQLSATQTYQGRLLTNLNTKVTKLCDLLLDPSDINHDHDVDMEPPGSPLSNASSNPSHGEPGGLVK